MKILDGNSWPDLLLTLPSEVRQLCMQRSLRVPFSSDVEFERATTRAKNWLVDVLPSHLKLLNPTDGIRMLRSAVEKELRGAKSQLTDVERLYMALARPDIPDPGSRLTEAFLLVLQLNFAERLVDVKEMVSRRRDTMKRTASLDAEVDTNRNRIAERIQDLDVDNFACAIPLTSLKLRPDVIDDNEGCCPVCQNSYTDLSTNTPQDLLADYPIRIKYCGHVIGKSCLERWMSTPKIDAAKYPHRTCPLCRVKIEGVPGPGFPPDLRTHVKTNRRALETLRELADGWDMDLDDCLDAIAACMSEEIACEEMLVVIDKAKGQTRWGYEDDEKKLRDKLEEIKKEKRAFGFRGDGVWRPLRDEWMNSGVVRKE
jgi:hypothetical protein